MELPFNGNVGSNPQWLYPHVKLSIYIATTVVIQETKLLNEIDVEKVAPVTLFIDNQSTIAIAKTIRNQRAKHIDIKYLFIRSEIENGTIALN